MYVLVFEICFQFKTYFHCLLFEVCVVCMRFWFWICLLGSVDQTKRKMQLAKEKGEKAVHFNFMQLSLFLGPSKHAKCVEKYSTTYFKCVFKGFLWLKLP